MSSSPEPSTGRRRRHGAMIETRFGLNFGPLKSTPSTTTRRGFDVQPLLGLSGFLIFIVIDGEAG